MTFPIITYRREVNVVGRRYEGRIEEVERFLQVRLASATSGTVQRYVETHIQVNNLG